MNSFSIAAYENQSVLDTYKCWLVKDVYNGFKYSDINDVNFMQKLSFLQAEGVRHDIAKHAADVHSNIQSAGSQIGVGIQNAASLITSSIEDGFALMNNQMLESNRNLHVLERGVEQMNQSLQQSNLMLFGIQGGIVQTNKRLAQLNKEVGAVDAGVRLLNTNLFAATKVLGNQIAQSASMIISQLQQVKGTLYHILDELKIPESQRERRYHIEEGIKYFNKGMQTGDCLYFEDALEEFSTAVSIERKDFFSWCYLGMIYLYSKDNIDLEKAILAFDRYIHYADALPQRHYLFDEVLMMKAECHYLKMNPQQAYNDISDILNNSIKASLRGIKYLSATKVMENQILATKILEELMVKNPYIVMQVLEDYDIVANEYIMQYLSEYRRSLLDNVRKMLAVVEKDFELLKNQKMKAFAQDIVLNMHKQEQSGIMDLLNLKKMLFSLEHYINVQKSLGPIPEAFENITQTFAQIKKIVGENENYILDRNVEASVTLLQEDLNRINYAIDEKKKEELMWELNRVGEEVHRLKEDFISRDFEFFFAEEKKLYGFKGKRSNRIIMPAKWLFAHSFSDGLAVVKDGYNKYGYINDAGKIVLPFQWEGASDFSDGIAAVKKCSKWGYIDKHGQVVIDFQFEEAEKFSDGLSAVWKNSKWGYINRLGQVVIKYRWRNASEFHEGLAVVKDKDEKYYIIDKDGKVICRYVSKDIRYIYDFSNGLACVKNVKGVYGYIDKNGCVVIPCYWKYASNFSSGEAIVEDGDGRWWRINKKGEIIGKR